MNSFASREGDAGFREGRMNIKTAAIAAGAAMAMPAVAAQAAELQGSLQGTLALG